MQVGLHISGDLALGEVVINHRLAFDHIEHTLGDAATGLCTRRYGGVLVVQLCHFDGKQLCTVRSTGSQRELSGAHNLAVCREQDGALGEIIRAAVEVLHHAYSDGLLATCEPIQAAVHVEITLDHLSRIFCPLLDILKTPGMVELHEAPVVEKEANALVQTVGPAFEPFVNLLHDGASLVKIRRDTHHHALRVRTPCKQVCLGAIILHTALAQRRILEQVPAAGDRQGVGPGRWGIKVTPRCIQCTGFGLLVAIVLLTVHHCVLALVAALVLALTEGRAAREKQHVPQGVVLQVELHLRHFLFEL
mmetsp:Transcript_55810/g.97823  ORF Transcript_55810/g.97823 Transcript_55810/m.97823 type:complete len:306 (+) Transcript_55810:807-1724(+)